MSDRQNDILYNIENDQDKTERITVYLNKEDRAALEAFRKQRKQRISDAAGDLIRVALRIAATVGGSAFAEDLE